MRGARAERSARDRRRAGDHRGRLEDDAGKTCGALQAIDVSRFLGDRRLSASSRAAYFGSIAAFYRWFGSHGGRNIHQGSAPSARTEGCTAAWSLLGPAAAAHYSTRGCISGACVMILLAALAGTRRHETPRGPRRGLRPRRADAAGEGQRRATNRRDPLAPLTDRCGVSHARRGLVVPRQQSAPRGGGHVHSKSVSDIIGNAMRRAGVAGRRTVCDIISGVPLSRPERTCGRRRLCCGKSNLQTTAIYVQVVDGKRVEAIDRLDPFQECLPPKVVAKRENHRSGWTTGVLSRRSDVRRWPRVAGEVLYGFRRRR